MFSSPAQFTRASHKRDGSMGIGFETSELNAKDKLKLIEHINLAGWIVFKEDAISDDDLPKEDSGFEAGKSPSQRLRAILYKFWKVKKSDEQPIFDVYYRGIMEKLIDRYKEELNK